MSHPTRPNRAVGVPKVIVCCKRAADRSVEDFRDWHRSTVASAASQLPGLIRLVESTTLARGTEVESRCTTPSTSSGSKTKRRHEPPAGALPIGWAIDGANRHDVRMLEPPAVGGSRARRLKGFRRRAGPPQ